MTILLAEAEEYADFNSSEGKASTSVGYLSAMSSNL